MSRKFAIKILEEKGEITITGKGNSMQPLIESGSSISLKKVLPSQLRVGDAVLCKVSKSIFVHLITAIDKDKNRFQISNNKGHINGTIGTNNIYGLCVKVNDKVWITDEELIERLK